MDRRPHRKLSNRFRKSPETETSTPAFLAVEEAFHDAVDALVAAGCSERDAGEVLLMVGRGVPAERLLPVIDDANRPRVAGALRALQEAAQRLSHPPLEAR